MIKAIIFDLWETLGTKNIGISKTLRDQFNIRNTSDFLVKYEQSIQLKEYKSYKEISKKFLSDFNLVQTENSINFVTQTLKKGIDKASMFKGMYELLDNLSKKYSLGILSNTSCFESKVVAKWGVNSFFKAQIYSWQIESIKPDFSSFEAACSALGVSQKEAIFIDDSERNISAAKKFGLNGIQYKSINQLKKKLDSYLNI